MKQLPLLATEHCRYIYVHSPISVKMFVVADKISEHSRE